MRQPQHEFVKQLTNSYPRVERVANWLRQCPRFIVYVSRPQISPDQRQNHLYRDHGDIWVVSKPDLQLYIVEVKGTSFARDTIFIDEVANFKNKPITPDYYVLLNSKDDQDNTAYIYWVGSHNWETITRKDPKKGRLCTYYRCPKGLLTKRSIHPSDNIR